MLINNAGRGGTTDFDERNFETFQTQIQLNVATTVQLTHLLLPELKRHPKSYVLNVSSLCIFFFLPRKQVYGGTKSFIYFFSKSLRKELQRQGVIVTVLCPGGINSNPAQYMLTRSTSALSRLAIMDPEEIAPIAVNGLIKGKERIIPGFMNRFFMCLDLIIPASLKNRLIRNEVNKLNLHEVEMLLRGERPDIGRKIA